jgi:hypothetical protein
MFSRIFSRRRGVFARKALPFFLALCFVTGAALFSGCAMDGGDGGGSIYGSWKSSFGETWTITPVTVTGDAYAGTIVNNPDFGASAGVIIIKYTTKPQYYDFDSNPPYDVTGGPYDPPGDYYAIYWKELTAASVEIANAWDITDFSYNGAPETKTLEEAEKKFTLDNVALYVSLYSTCERQ